MTGFQLPNYTQVPNFLLDVLMADMFESELKVTLAIVRRIIGFHKVKPVPVSLTDLEYMTGLSRQACIEGTELALQRGFVVKSGSGKRGVNLYTLSFEEDESTSQLSGLVNSGDQNQSTELTRTSQLSRHIKEIERKEIKDSAAKNPPQVLGSSTWAERQKAKEALIVSKSKSSNSGGEGKEQKTKLSPDDFQAGDVRRVILSVLHTLTNKSATMTQAQSLALAQNLLTKAGDTMKNPQWYYERYPEKYREYLENRIPQQLTVMKLGSNMTNIVRLVTSPSYKTGWIDFMFENELTDGLPIIKHQENPDKLNRPKTFQEEIGEKGTYFFGSGDESELL